MYVGPIQEERKKMGVGNVSRREKREYIRGAGGKTGRKLMTWKT